MKNKNKLLPYISTFLLSFLLLGQNVLADTTGRVSANQVDAGCDIIPQSVMDIINQIWYLILIAGPLIFIVMSLIDIFKTISGSEEKAFKSLLPRIIKRLIGVVILILLPILINFVLGLINTNFGSCVS